VHCGGGGGGGSWIYFQDLQQRENRINYLEKQAENDQLFSRVTIY